ncbi:mitochondrial fission 1 protein [Atractiella rhizophila]|nr:mitochondrial fission 1 protein [Atractiella rhizophila]
MQYPMVADSLESISEAELRVLRNQYLIEGEKGFVSTQTKFNLAWGLVKSQNKAEIEEGVSLLMDIYRTDAPRRRECLYYLALGHYKLQNWTEARRFNELLLEKEPKNLQAQSLADLIEKGVQRDGYLGLAIAGGAAAIGAVALFMLRNGARR